jgi:heme o synthase
MSTQANSENTGSQRGVFDVLADYVELAKPRIIFLLLVTTHAAMLIAGGKNPPLSFIALVLLGGTLVSGSANAFNMVYDKDIDAIMKRTRRRPIPSGRVSARQAMIFATAIGVGGVVLLALWVNPLAAALAAFGHFFYVFIYTMWLKRASVQNIVIGGAAGAVPPMVGWAAVTGSVDLAALVLFLIIFLWTPPHFWALAYYKNDDYRAAGVPMMPVVKGNDETIRQSLIYTALLIPASLLLIAVLPMTVFYLMSALILGALFAYFMIDLARRRTVQAAKRLFAYSIVYLGLIFGAMVVDRVVLGDVLRPVIAGTGVSGLPIDYARTIDVKLGGEAAEGIPLEAKPSVSRVRLHPNEPRHLVFSVTNTSDEPVAAMAEHHLVPAAAAGFFKKVECFCYRAQYWEPGETVEMPMSFSFVDALPADIGDVSVTFRFVALPWEDDEDGRPNHAHDHEHHHEHHAHEHAH